MSKQLSSIPENLLISSSMVFFLIHSMQVGVGILGFEKYIASEAGYDAWISIIIGGAGLHLLLWMIYRILHKTGGDIVTVHSEAFGKYVGGFLSILFSLYCLLLSFTVLRTFIEVVQTWVFPKLPVWLFAAVFLLIIYYYIEGGLRVITGAAFMGVWIGLPLLLFKIIPIRYGNVENVYPSIDHTWVELLASTKFTLLSFLGIGLLFVYYPFIKKKSESKKWAHFGVFYTTLIYLVTAIVAFSYFNEEQLKHTTWGTVTLWKIIDVGFVARFEYIGIALWVFVVIPNICLALWAASRIPKRVFSVRQRHVLWLYCTILLIAAILVDDRASINRLNTFTGEIGFCFFVYVPVLFIWTMCRRKGGNEHES
ncbi:UNVERIFIED_CONTAM: GerAB/ArcD/ProY family transporter [Halobacillus marinus]